MSKADYRAAKRLAPMGEEGLEAMRQILAGRQRQKINEVLIDAFSASLIVQVFDRLNPVNRANLLARPVAQVADICFKLAA